ncbi:MAG: phospholipid carrier-dependent glycosyltransferase, partial [Solirubrobacteraceae bacterium]
DGLPYVEKPPLQYWATAASYRLFGQSELSARLYTALAAFATLLAVWLLAVRLWNREAAWRSAAVLASLSLFPVTGQLLSLDMSLTFFMTLSLVSFLWAQCRTPAGGGRAMLLAWAAAAGGVMTKGLVAAAVPAAVLVLYSLTMRDWAVWRRLRLGAGLALFAVLSVPWHWLAARRLPDFLEFFFVHEHLERYLTNVSDRVEPWWFFAAVFLAGTLPWTVSALRVLGVGWRRREPPGAFEPRVFLWIWVVFVLVFFSLSDSKLIPYVLPALPALALSIGSLPAAVLRRDVLAAALVTLAAALACLLAGLLLPHWLAGSVRAEYFLPLGGPLLRIAAVLAVSGGYLLVRRDREPTGGAVFLGVGWALAVLLLVRSAGLAGPLYSGRSLAALLPEAGRGLPIYTIATYDQTLPFYWRRTLHLVSYRGELDYGLRHTPGSEIATIPEFVAHWSAMPMAYAVMESDMYEDLQARGVPMRYLGHDGHRVLVARR